MTGKERREQLLDIGRRLFAERGFEGTSIEEIAAQAGVSKPVVYEHFGGKEGLYAVVVDREVERLLTMATTLLLEGDNTREKFEAAAVSLLQYIDDNADGFRILVRDSNPGSGTGTYGTLLSDIAGQVEYILADFLSSRGHDPKLAPLYSQMLVGMVAFTGQWWLDARKPKLEEVAANLIDLAWNGLSQLDSRDREQQRGLGGRGARRQRGGTSTGRCRWQARGRPGAESADHVGRLAQPQIVQGRRRQAGGIPLLAQHNDPVVIASDPGQPGITGWIETPFQVVALDDCRAGDLALRRPLRGGPDVDQHPAVGRLPERVLRGQPGQPGARLRQNLLNRARARRLGRHHAADHSAAASVPRTTSPVWVSS
jgi:AcrR family transcriptional regulator